MVSEAVECHHFPFFKSAPFFLPHATYTTLGVIRAVEGSQCIKQQLITEHCVCVCVLVAQSCLTLCDPMGFSLPASSVHGILQSRILHSLLQGIFPTQGSNPGLLQQISCDGWELTKSSKSFYRIECEYVKIREEA